MGDTANLPQENTYTLPQQLSVLAILETRSKVEVAGLKSARPGLLAEMVADFKETGSKTRVLKADGKRLGTATLNEVGDKASVSNKDAYRDWVEEHYPTEVEYVAVVKEAFAKKHVDPKRLERVEDPDNPGEFLVFDKILGIPVDGVTISPGADKDPESFTIRMTAEEKELALAIANGVDLAALAAPKQITADTVVEGDLTFVADTTGNVQAPGTAEDIVDAEVVDDAAA